MMNVYENIIMIVHNPPLWVWAIIIAAIVIGKFAYRWTIIKELADRVQQKRQGAG
jgi:phosphate/sulfate permease